MKTRYLVLLSITFLLAASCATKIPFTEKIRTEFDLTESKMKQVQFYTSRAIILERSDEKQVTATTGKEGDLVVSSTASSERIVIPANRPCILEKVEEDGSVAIRFELGAGRYLRFKQRPNATSDRFYLQADWKDGKGELDYGGAVYYAVSGSSSAYLLVKLKQWQRNKRKDRIVKGMKVN
jgi:hypothetical protein